MKAQSASPLNVSPTRRETLRWAAGAALAALADRPVWSALVEEAVAAAVTLRTAAARAGLYFGSDSDVQLDEAPKEYAAMFTEQCELYAPNLSWASVTPKRGAKDPSFEEPNVAFAREHGLRLTGFHLLWHERTPAWVKKLASADEMLKAITQHASAMGLHYGARVYSWNVVNEALAPQDGRPYALRRSPVFDKLGLDVFDGLFRAAAAVLPTAIRAYNDYGLELESRGHEAKRRALLRLIDELQRRGAPIDAVGLQSHLSADGAAFNEKVYRRFLSDLASRGLKILITELDVSDRDAPGGIAARDRAVAEMYRRFLSVVLDEPATAAVVTWGLSDKYTWLTAESDPSFRRADGKPNRPLPFDEALKMKPSYEAILTAFQNAPPRPRVIGA